MKSILFSLALAAPLFAQAIPSPEGDWSLRAKVVRSSDADGNYFTAVTFKDGHAAGIPLDGVRVVVVGNADKSVVVFDPSVTEEQRRAIRPVLDAVFLPAGHEPIIEEHRIDWDNRGDNVSVRVAGRGEISFVPDRDNEGQPVSRKMVYCAVSPGGESISGKATFSYVGEGLAVKNAKGAADSGWMEIERWNARAE